MSEKIETLQSKQKMIFKWLLNIVVPAAVMLIPTSADGFTNDMRTFLVITLFGIILLATENLPTFTVSLLLPPAYIIFMGLKANAVLSGWTNELPWVFIGGSILNIALQGTGLMKRLAYRCVLFFGGTYRGALYGLTVFGAVAAFLISAPTARAILIPTLAVGINNAFGFKLGDRESSCIGMVTVNAVISPIFFTYTGGPANIVPFGILQELGLAVPSYLEYMVQMTVPALIYCILNIIMIELVFRPKPTEALAAAGITDNPKEKFKLQLSNMGKMSINEKKITVICVLLLAALLTSGTHGIAIPWIFIITAGVLTFPGIELAKNEDFKKINFPMAFFLVACLTIGTVSAQIGFSTFLANLVFPYLSTSFETMVGGVWVLGFLVNFVMTPNAAYAAFTAPIAEMAVSAGFDHLPVIYSMAQGLTQIVFPYEFAVVLLISGFGLCSFNRLIKYNFLRAVLNFIAIYILYLPWWSLVGIL